MASFSKIVLTAATGLLVQACASAPERLEAVPSELSARAELPGMPGVRYVAGGDMSELTRIAIDSLRKEQEYRSAQEQTGSLPAAVYLAISGGGDNGAYRAGLLNRLDGSRDAARVQARHGHQHGRTDRAVRVSRTQSTTRR